MKRQIAISIVFLQLILLFSGCADQPATTNDRFPAESDLITDTQIIDYVDILSNSAEYDGKTVSVAGQISELGSNSYVFYFYDRLGNSTGGQKFLVSVDRSTYESNYSQPLNVGDYVVVEGIWKYGGNGLSSDRLTSAIVTITGAEAKSIVAEYISEWEKEKDSLTKTLPLLDYFDVIENSKDYENQYIRIAGQVSLPQVYSTENYVYFRFKGPKAYGHDVVIYLQGCPQEMQDLCCNGEYIVVTGVASRSIYGVALHDCYVEKVGEEAKKAFESISVSHPVTTPNPDPMPTPTQQQSSQTWVLNTNTMKIHYPSCSSVSRIAAGNYATSTASIDELLRRGYTRCGRCF